MAAAPTPTKLAPSIRQRPIDSFKNHAPKNAAKITETSRRAATAGMALCVMAHKTMP